MSRARELAKVGGLNQQVISGLSTHVGISTFAADVVMYEDLTVNGNTAVGGNLTVTGTTTFNGGTLTLGDAATDNVVFGGDVNSNIIPNTDNAYDLGSSSQEWKDLYVDGTANIDSLVADTADINGGTADNVVIGGSTAAAGSFTTVAASSNATITGNLDVDGATTLDGLTVAEAASFSNNVAVTGTLDVDGATTLDGLTVAEGASFSSTLGVTGTTTLAGQLDANGDVNLGNAATDSVTVTGRFDSDLLPIADGTSDLGSSTLEWQDLYIDGTANIDSLVADTADINGGTADNVVIGGSTAAAGSFTTVLASSDVAVTGDFDVDGDTTLDTTDVAGTLTVVGNAVVDNVTVDGNTVSTSSGNLTLNSTGGTVALPTVTMSGGVTASGQVSINNNLNVTGNTDLGNATSDTITATGRFDSDLVPSTDGARDLGSSTLEWQDLYIDGTANIDSLVADTADINGGTIDAAVIGGSTAAAGSFTTVAASSNATITGNLDVDGATTLDGLTVAENAAFSANLDVDGATTLDGLTVAEGASFSSTLDVDGATTLDGLTVAENATFSAAIDVDGHTNLDNVSIAGVSTMTGASTFSAGVTIAGALDANGGASIDNVRIGVANDNEIDTSSGNLVIDSAGGTTTVDDNLTVSGNLTVNGTTTTINSTTVAIDDKNFQVATGAADDSAADGAGLTVDSGDGDKTWNFEATGDNWGASENINIASGKSYKINNTAVLNATTLGSSVVASSLTSVGTIATGVWQGTAIANGYLANSTVSYGGVSLALGASDGTPAFDLSDATNYPTSSLSGTITNAQLAGSIAASKLAGSIGNAKLSNSTVSYGGIELALGASDATPAFDLSDATNYPTSSLSGTITNAQLAGSIANGKLSNSSVSFGGVSLSLGGSDGTPAFDLSDATNYPTSSLSGTITNAQLAGSIANSKLSTISTANKVSISALNIDGGTDINAALVDADEIIVDDGGGGTNRRCDMSRVKTYIYGAMSGDATAGSGGAVTLAASGVSAATYGSATAIPQITVDAKGRITSATTNNVNTTTNLGKSTATGQITITSSTGDNVVIGEATASIAGLMSTTHHDKLDGIESGATADQTASEILTLIKTVDGSGSGLDSDTVDGIHASSFVRSDTSDTMSGTLTMSGNIVPNADSSRDLGTNSVRWANVYADDVRAGDIHLSNEHRMGGNDIDGSWGSYVMQEGENDLFLKNTRTGKSYKFMLQEV